MWDFLWFWTLTRVDDTQSSLEWTATTFFSNTPKRYLPQSRWLVNSSSARLVLFHHNRAQQTRLWAKIFKYRQQFPEVLSYFFFTRSLIFFFCCKLYIFIQWKLSLGISTRFVISNHGSLNLWLHFNKIFTNFKIFTLNVKGQLSQSSDILRTQTGRCAYSRTIEQHLILSILRCSARTLTFV